MLSVRKNFEKIKLEKLYDPDTMPEALRKAHMANDKAVMKAYGLTCAPEDEATIVAHLLKLYQEKVQQS